MEKNIHQENPEKKNPGISIRKKISFLFLRKCGVVIMVLQEFL